MVQWLRTRAFLPGDAGSISSTHMASQLSVTPVPGDPTISSGLCRHCHTWYTDIHEAAHRNLKNIFLFFLNKKHSCKKKIMKVILEC